MSYSRYNTEQRIWLVKQKYLLQHNISIQRLWVKEWESVAPDNRTINNIFAKWEKSGSVHDAQRCGRPVSVTINENKESVSEHFQNNPSSSASRASLVLDVSRTSLRRMIKELGLHLYRPRLVQELNEDDFDRRVEFCEKLEHMFCQKPELIDCIIWSDEATFKLDGSVNRHNSTYYARENPHVTIKR